MGAPEVVRVPTVEAQLVYALKYALKSMEFAQQLHAEQNPNSAILNIALGLARDAIAAAEARAACGTAETIVWHKPSDKLPDDDYTTLIEVAHHDSDGTFDYSEVIAATKDGDQWRPIDSCEPTTGRVIAWADWPVGPRGVA